MKTTTILVVGGLGLVAYMVFRQPKVVTVQSPATDPLKTAAGNLLQLGGEKLIGAIFGSKEDPTKSDTAKPTGATTEGNEGPPLFDWGRFSL